MWPRLPRRQWEAGKGEGNRQALRRLVRRGSVPGVLGYADGEPVAWCAIEPREAFGTLARSRVPAPVDGTEVWSVVCLFIAPPFRGRGLSGAIVEGAVRHARRRGARVIEAYPVDPRRGRLPAAFVYPGLPSTYASAGFTEVARRSPTRPIMRLGPAGARRARSARPPRTPRRTPRTPARSRP